MIITAYVILLLPLLVVPVVPHENSAHDIESINNSVILSRIKRGSTDIFGHIKNTVSSSIGKASASSAGSSSHGSSKAYSYEKPVVKEFDAWGLKKSILNTLFQAVKAITGGITALNGQLIKGSGYALSHGGKLVAKSGDVVTNVGKKIALSAHLIPPGDKHHTDYSYGGGHFSKYFGSSSGHSSSGNNDHHEEAFSSPTGPSAESYSHTHSEVHAGPPYLPIPYDTNFHVAPTAHEHAHPYPSSYGNGPEVHSKSSKYKKLDTTPITGPELTDQNDPISALANKKAVEALELLLRKLPHKFTLQADIKKETIDNDIVNTPPKQYNIPKDPIATSATTIPPFKPLRPLTGISSTYTLQLGPYEAVSQHFLTEQGTGSVNVDKPKKYNYDRPARPLTVSQQPLPAVAAHAIPIQYTNSIPIQSPMPPQIRQLVNSPQLLQAHVANLPPLDLYHTMTLKQNDVSQTAVQSGIPAAAAAAAVLYEPFEITKSVAYEI